MHYTLVKEVLKANTVEELARVLAKSAGFDTMNLSVLNHVLQLKDQAEAVGYSRAANYFARSIQEYSDGIQLYVKL